MILRCTSSSLPKKMSQTRPNPNQRELYTKATQSWQVTLSTRPPMLEVAMTRCHSSSRRRETIAGNSKDHLTRALENSSRAEFRRMLSATRLLSSMELNLTNRWEWSQETRPIRIILTTRSHTLLPLMETFKSSPLVTLMVAFTTGMSPRCDQITIRWELQQTSLF